MMPTYVYIVQQGEDSQDMSARTGQQDRDKQTEQNSQNSTARTGN
jgi:hypothetical protein